MLCIWQKRFRERCKHKLDLLREKEASLQRQLQDALRAKVVLEDETKRLQEHVEAMARNRSSWRRDNGEVSAASACSTCPSPQACIREIANNEGACSGAGRPSDRSRRAPAALAQNSWANALTPVGRGCSLLAERVLCLDSNGQRRVHTDVARGHPAQRAVRPAAVA